MITDRYSNIIERYDYTLGTAGERLSVQETNRTITYTYDNLYRLTQETIQDGALNLTIDYTYDAVGNRLTQTDLTGTTVYTYNALNQLILENDTVYTYDDNGALIAVQGPDRSAEYTYNDLGRMSTASVTTGTTTVTESYLYDWAGTRTAKITDGVLTYYLVDTGGVLSQVLAELDHTGALITHYTRGAELICLSRPGEKHYYLHDGHGSVRALSDADGQVTDTYLFDAFGNLLTKTGTTANDFLYTGEQYDANTGFYYLRARYMNPSTGTFTSPDAYAGTIFDPVSLHKYLYANANPVMNRDPSGYMAEAFIAGEACRSILAKQEAEYNSTVIATGTKLIKTILLFSAVFAPISLFMAVIIDACFDDVPDAVWDRLADIIRDIIIVNTITIPIAGAFPIDEATTDTDDKKKGPYTVYVLVDKTIESDKFPYFKVLYVGRTNNMVATTYRHNHNPARAHLIPYTLHTNLTKEAAKGLEQAYILFFSTLNNTNSAYNQINGISPTNPNIAAYEASALTVLTDESETYVGGVFYQ